MRLSVFALAGALLIGHAAHAHAQILTGRVVELGSERPVAAASIGILDGDDAIVSTESDSTGFFRLVLPGPGQYEIIEPGSLEGVEIYRHRMEVPFEYGGPHECGAILFWTREGEPRTPVGFWT